MARPRKNRLEIIPLPGGLFELRGYILGKRHRIRSGDYGQLDQNRIELEQQLVDLPARSQTLRMTRLTEAQLRDAEAAVERAGARSLLACVEASDRVMVTGAPVDLVVAQTDWIARQEKLGLFASTRGNNLGRSRAFIAWLAERGVTSVQAVLPEHFEAFVYRGERADFTRKNDAAVLQAWANHWKARRWVKEIPFEIDFKGLRSRARAADLPRILSPEQARGLLAAAKAKGGARLAAYVALACWCFARHAEVLRVSPIDIKLGGKVPVVEIRPRKRNTVRYRTITVPACVLEVLLEAKAETLKIAEAERAAAIAKAATPEAQAAAEKMEPGPVADYGRVRWGAVRKAAGLAVLGAVKNKKRAVVSTVWQENILRHTGLSYLFQQNGDIREVTRQAGNSSGTAFAHYLNLPEEGASEAFFA